MSNFALPVVATVPGFSVEYSINSGPFTANPMTSMTPGCYTIIARYVLASTCGNTTAGTAGSGLWKFQFSDYKCDPNTGCQRSAGYPYV
ncbi:MAG: hypothetical protein IPN89_13725 [Saprospiraceae bacterium]|nr:hypothetical protein [Saprospiraceae bacterium]